MKLYLRQLSIWSLGLCGHQGVWDSLLSLTYFKDTFSCSPINMKFAPHKICSISTQNPTHRTDCTVKVMWAELRKSWKLGARWHRPNCEYCTIMNNDLVKMTSWDCQEGNRECTSKFSSNSIHTNSPQIHPNNIIFTILRPRLLQLWYMESYR